MTTLGKIAVASRPMSEAAHSTEGCEANGKVDRRALPPDGKGATCRDEVVVEARERVLTPTATRAEERTA